MPNKEAGNRKSGVPLVPLTHTLSERTGPVFGHDAIRPLDHDLTRNGVKNGEVLGERIIVTGWILDEAAGFKAASDSEKSPQRLKLSA